MATVQKITPNLWFDNQAEEAAKFYVSVFKNSKINRTTYYSNEGFEIHRMPSGTVMTVDFELEGVQFVALNGGPVFKFNESISFIINCKDQGEIDYYWERLTAGGDPESQQCGWLKDKFGVSWQVVPEGMGDFFANQSQEKVDKAMRAMLKMKKIDFRALTEA